MRPTPDALEDAGRGTDNVLGHLTTGELVVPVVIVNNPEYRKTLEDMFSAIGVNFNEFLVGDSANKINPETGYPEFFLGKIFKGVGRVVKTVVGGVAGALGLAPKALQMPTMPPPPPTVATPQVRAAADAQRMRARAASGRASTMLSNREDRAQPMTATRKLLGQ